VFANNKARADKDAFWEVTTQDRPKNRFLVSAVMAPMGN
jgi:hypothetical protein